MRHKSSTYSRGSSPLSDKPPPPTTEQRIAQLLLENDANLLAVICQATFVGDTAASVSLEVLALLRKQSARVTEAFLKRLLRTRIEGYIMKSRDLSDIIRDNSMATMLLNAFARYEGLSYLGQTLGEPLRDILPFVDGCEIDPQKFPQDMDPSAVEDLLAENEARLKSACSRLLTSVVEKRGQMPFSLRRMCKYLREIVDEIYKEAAWEAGAAAGMVKSESVESAGNGKVLNVDTVKNSTVPEDDETGGPISSVSTFVPEEAQSPIRPISTATRVTTAVNEEEDSSRPVSMTPSVGPPLSEEEAQIPAGTDAAIPPTRLEAQPVASELSMESLELPQSIIPTRDQQLAPTSKDRSLGNGDVNKPGLVEQLSSPATIPGSPRSTFRLFGKRLSTMNKSNDQLSPAPSNKRFSALNKSNDSLSAPAVKPLSGLNKSNEQLSSRALKATKSNDQLSTAISKSDKADEQFASPAIKPTKSNDQLSSPASKSKKSNELLVSSPAGGALAWGKRSLRLSPTRSQSAAIDDRDKHLLRNALATARPPESAPNSTTSSGQPPLPPIISGTSSLRLKPGNVSVIRHRGSFASFRRSMPTVAPRTSMGYLTIPEKVVGSFLFLRFFVPAITSPDTYGLVEGRVQPSARRGLVLCGKVLTAMCNDVDFGNKEQYLMCLNHFLRENREKIKDFLIFASEEPPEPEAPDEPDSYPSLSTSSIATTAAPVLPVSGRSTLRKALSRSMPSLKPVETLTLHSIPATARTLPRSRSGDHVDTSNFYQYLGKSLKKIERDMEEQLFYLPPHESEGIVNSFQELKRIIQASHYADGGGSMNSGATDRSGHKSQTLFAKFSSKMPWKGIFQGAHKTQSLDDLHVHSAAKPTARSSPMSKQISNELSNELRAPPLGSTGITR
ncbi:Ras GTPase activating protein ira2 [Thoreauomyces humboldtii]|nr:Ras GTPase activating protein ira2 [Thoreauomyces humboldtii]